MIPRPHPALLLLTVLVTFPAATPARAEESGAFVTRLGRDTTSVERYTRSESRLVVEQVGRAPRVLQRRCVYEYAGGEISTFTMVVTPPGSSTPTQTTEATFGPDSMRLETRTADGAPRRQSLALGRGTLVAAGSSPWPVYEGLIAKLAREKRDSLRADLYLVGSAAPTWIRVRRLGRDSVAVFNGRPEQFHARVDPAGRVLGVLPVAGTFKVGVERVATLDLDGLAAGFAAREQAGVGLGALSPRDTARAENAGGASIWIDYGRPSKRGRVVFGPVVPFGQLWRTGANAATQLKTDSALDFGGTVVPAGFYSLWTIPSPGGWKLIVNSETGQAGTAHKPEKDLYTIEMAVSALPEVVEQFTIRIDSNAQGGVLHLDWDTTRASAAFTVRR